jgi:hypothetical protein
MKKSYLENEYSGYTLWDDIEEYEHHDVDQVASIAVAAGKDGGALIIVSHGTEHPLSGLPEERTFIELTADQYTKLVAAINGIEQTRGSAKR